MKASLSLLAGLLLSLAPAQAAPPSPESIEHLLKSTNAEQLVATMQGQVEGMMKTTMAQALKGQTVSAEQQKTMDLFVTKTMATMKDELSWDKLKDLYTRVYSESFTQEEVDGLIAFYESAAGQAFVKKMPVVMQKTMSLMKDRMGPMMERMQKDMQETMAEVQAQKEKRD